MINKAIKPSLAHSKANNSAASATAAFANSDHGDNGRNITAAAADKKKTNKKHSIKVIDNNSNEKDGLVESIVPLDAAVKDKSGGGSGGGGSNSNSSNANIVVDVNSVEVVQKTLEETFSLCSYFLTELLKVSSHSMTMHCTYV